MTTQGEILEIFNNAMLVALKVAGPLLLASIVIGLVVAIFQAATQIHEQTLTFVPKLIVISLALLILGSTMMNAFNEFFKLIFNKIANL
ncbi:MAG: flagellar biosynthesis protein FliQ [Clostridiales bacterium]|nr:flagellar biosynthesis protein FliQ [Clostridiales bacterium]